MKKLMPLVAFLCLVSWVGAAALTEKHEGLQFNIGDDWKAERHSDTDRIDTIEFVRKEDDINTWKELFTYQDFGRRRFKHPPEDELNLLKASREKKCPGQTEWNVIERNENSTLFEWKAKPCLGWPEEHEIARIIYGKYSWFFLQYAAKVYELAPDTRAQWIKTLSDATVNPDAGSLNPTEDTNDVDEVVPFALDKVTAALKPAMESEGCKVVEAVANRIECKRARGFAGGGSYGGESVTATVEAQGDKTRVHISTGKGFYGRLGKQNWSAPIYQEMMVSLQKAQP